MEKDPYDIALSKARAFFKRAEEVASTNNFDYAIELYLDGLRLSPDALEDGHGYIENEYCRAVNIRLVQEFASGCKESGIEAERLDHATQRAQQG